MSPIVALQAAVGNQTVQRLIRSGRVRAPGAQMPGLIQRKVGFEFQMLDSDVTLKKGNKETDKISWGDASWHIENDGKNIEFVISAVDDPAVAASRVGAVAGVAKKLNTKGAVKQEHSKPAGQTNHIVVHAPDTSGQPQINSDIGLDQLATGHLGYQKGQDQANKEYFGAEKPAFNWSFGRTKTQMDRVETIRDRMAEFSDADVLDYMQLDIGYSHKIPVKEAGPASVKNAVKLVRAYCITEAAVRETAPTNKGLTKDMPLLPKLDLASVEREILDVLKRGLNTSNQFKAENVAKLQLEYRFEDIIAILQKASGSGREKPDVFEKEGTSRHVFGLKEAARKDIARTRGKYSVLMELRRVPIQPVTEWVQFAVNATQAFGNLDA